MSEVTDGELVMWSVDPGPMAGVLERQLWRMAVAARSYLNRMRSAEADLDAVTVERDEAKEACDLLEMERDDSCGKLDDLRADLHNVRAHSVAAEQARDLAIVERDEAYKQRDNCERKIEDARDILGAAPEELLSDAARRVVDARDSLIETDPHKTVLDEVRRGMGLEVGDSVVDRVRRFVRLESLVDEARKYLEPLVSDPSGDIEDLAMMVAHRIAHTVSPTDDRDLRQILRARDGESLKDAARRAAVGAEPPQVFRPFITVTMCPDRKGEPYASLDVSPICDPGFLALSGHQLARLGLVVCDG